MIEYVLEPNERLGESKKCRAQVVNARNYTFDDIANHLKQRTGLESPMIYGVWEGIIGAVKEYLLEGGSINTDLFQVNASIQGVFDGLNDNYDGNRHKMWFNMQPGLLLSNVPVKMKVKKLSAELKCYIESVTDVKTGSVNSFLTPGKNIRILGQKLKIEGPDPACGLYFVSPNNHGQQIKVESSEFIVNNPSEIVAVVPKLAKGNWHIRLVTQYCSNGKYLKSPKDIIFDKTLTVA
jgi:hypothetical protein